MVLAFYTLISIILNLRIHYCVPIL